ncbi:MAG: glycosyltransferase family 2 protein [Clostridiales bacterium]|nr:glycosyltransferase family 2 protein [Clostridiales bacterium]
MLFSVIVPIYKSEAFLRECVDSILAQTFRDFELILVDDGSPDGCPDICDEYEKTDKRVVVIHKDNGGVTSARKAGANAARGEYIVCVDSDDTVSPEYLHMFNDALKAHDADAVCCGTVKFYRDTTVMKPVKARSGFFTRADLEREIFPRLIENAYADSFTSNVCAKAVRREIFVKVQNGIDDRIKIGEDSVCIRSCIFMAQSMFVIDGCLYNYRTNPQSAIMSAKPRNWDEAKLIGNSYKRFIDLSQFDFEAQFCRNITHKFFNICLSHLGGNEPYKMVRKEIKRQLKDDFYRQCIKQAKYYCRQGKFMVFALKHKFVWLIKKYARSRRSGR